MGPAGRARARQRGGPRPGRHRGEGLRRTGRRGRAPRDRRRHVLRFSRTIARCVGEHRCRGDRRRPGHRTRDSTRRRVRAGPAGQAPARRRRRRAQRLARRSRIGPGESGHTRGFRRCAGREHLLLAAARAVHRLRGDRSRPHRHRGRARVARVRRGEGGRGRRPVPRAHRGASRGGRGVRVERRRSRRTQGRSAAARLCRARPPLRHPRRRFQPRDRGGTRRRTAGSAGSAAPTDHDHRLVPADRRDPHRPCGPACRTDR